MRHWVYKREKRLFRFLVFLMIVAPVLITTSWQVSALKGYNAGFPTMERPELLPFWLPDGTQTKQFITYDVTGNNDDWKGWTRYTDANGELVFFDEYGPGCLYRQQFNVWHLDAWRTHSFDNVRIKYYFDDETTPRLNMLVNDFFGKGQNYVAPFTQPLVFYNYLPNGCCGGTDSFANSYYPFPFQKRLKITLFNAPTSDPSFPCGDWFQYTYQRYPTATEVQTWTPGADSTIVRNQWNNLGVDPKDATGNVIVNNNYVINNGSSATVLDLSGQGSIAGLKFTLNPWDSATFNNTKIKIFWDNSGTPAVNQSLGSFFGGGGDPLGKTVYNLEFTNLFYGYSYTNKRLFAYWPMPYWSRAQIVIENNSGKNITNLGVEAKYKTSGALNYPPGQAGYFHAKRTIELNSSNYYSTAFEDQGKGQVVGLMMYSNNYAMDGDEFTYIDDSNTPAIHGDGTEDDHNQGYGGNAYQKPLWGGLINGSDGAYRTYYNDMYVYDRQIRILYEHSPCGGGQTGQSTDFTVWYYKKDPGDGASGNLKLTDQLDVGDPGSESSHSYTVNGQTQLVNTNSAYDGMEFNINGHKPANDSGRYNKGYSQFVVSIDPANTGVLLRKRINRSGDNVQKASVYVDGTIVTEAPWYFCDLNAPANQAFADTNLVIPKSYTQGKSSIIVKVQYLDATDHTNGINEYYYWVYSYAAVVLPTPTPTPSPSPTPTPEPTPAGTNLALGATASASSIWDGNYTAPMANDNNLSTRWNSAPGNILGEWLALDFGTARTFNAVCFDQETTWTRITSYHAQYWDGSNWQNAYTGGTMGDTETDRFGAITSSKIRLLVNSTTGGTPTIKEFRVYNEGGGSPTHTEEFNSGSLNPAWTWVREDNTKWSLTANPGNMRITCQTGELAQTDNTAKNPLLRIPSAGDWSIRTKVTFNPSVGNQQAGLLVYQDDHNYLKLVRCYNGANRVHYAKETGGTYTMVNETAQAATTVYLKIAKSGTTYTGYYNTDGSENWIQVGSTSVSLNNVKCGLACFAGPATDADFDWYDDGTAGATPTPTPTPVGHSDEFNSSILNAAWSWVREDSANWSLTARSGFMRITLQGQDLYQTQNDVENILLRTPGISDWSIGAKLDFNPTQAFQQAGLIVYADDDNYVKLIRFHDGSANLISLEKEIGGSYSTGVRMGQSATTVYLKITKSGATYSGYYNLDGGANWTSLGSTTASLTNLKVGLVTMNTPGVSGDFDWFDVR